MRKFKPKDVVKCYGSEGQFLFYGVIKDDEGSMNEKKFYYPYYAVAILKDYPRAVTDEDIYGFGCVAIREEEMEMSNNELQASF